MQYRQPEYRETPLSKTSEDLAYGHLYASFVDAIRNKSPYNPAQALLFTPHARHLSDHRHGRMLNWATNYEQVLTRMNSFRQYSASHSQSEVQTHVLGEPIPSAYISDSGFYITADITDPADAHKLLFMPHQIPHTHQEKTPPRAYIKLDGINEQYRGMVMVRYNPTPQSDAHEEQHIIGRICYPSLHKDRNFAGNKSTVELTIEQALYFAKDEIFAFWHAGTSATDIYKKLIQQTRYSLMYFGHIVSPNGRLSSKVVAEYGGDYNAVTQTVSKMMNKRYYFPLSSAIQNIDAVTSLVNNRDQAIGILMDYPVEQWTAVAERVQKY